MPSSALLYVRVSSKEQEKEGFSLDAQEKLGYDYAQRKGLKIAKIWRVSESAWREERTAFNQMIDYAKRHREIEHVIFDVTDRMTRNDFDKLKIYTLIKEHAKTIHFSRSNKILNREATSEDVFMLDIEVAVAKKMSNDISRKTRMGMQEKAEQGLYPSVAPIGYKNNRLTGLLDIDEAKAPFVKRMFELMATGNYSYFSLSLQLYKEGLRNKNGNRCGKSAIPHFLRNPIYYGAFRWKGRLFQGSHIPIVTKGLFDKVQNVMDGNTKVHIQRKGFAFNNLIWCGHCGCKVIGEKKKQRYHYYHCTFSKGRHENRAYLREEKIAELLGDKVRAVTISKDLSDWLKEALREASKASVEFREKRMGTLKTQYEKVNGRLSRLYDAKFDNAVPENIFVGKEKEYQGQLVEIKASMDGLQRVDADYYDEGCRALELCNRLYPLYVKADMEEKAKIANLVASNYSLVDVSLVPKWRKPFSFFAEGLSRPEWLPVNKRETKIYQITFLMADCPNRVTKRYLFVQEFKDFQDQKFCSDCSAKRYLNPLRKALRWQSMLEKEGGLNNALLAKRLGTSRVRVTQYLNLLRLPAWAQDKLLKVRGITERTLRPLVQIQNQRVFKAAFQAILDQSMSPQTGAPISPPSLS